MNRKSKLGQIFLLTGGLVVGLGLGLLSLLFLRDDRPDQVSIDIAQAGSLPAAPKVGSPAREFELESLSGKTVSLQDLRGKPVVLNYWATWCIPCEAEMPLLQESFERYPGMEVLGINFAEHPADVQAFVDKQALTFEILLDPRAIIQSLYRVRGYPTTYFVDGEGIIQGIHIGVLNQRQLNEYLERIGVGG
jgi:cytochrome c biogenesis protein CcmG/thiol:disulfide interchange protein DsbE